MIGQDSNRKAISSTVDRNTWEEFQEVSRKTLIPVSKLLDCAMQDLIDKYNKTGKIQ